ncbi:DUF624 domain-containing protein [Gracilibacillus alcaliphilus]|uniref:DUF624 domain-containing protein n=1 Tax=Gracilibacillus alcaliphilus TaxID=1401441 RepID=UPI0030843F77|nr:putative membrane protein YesL [Gracilibacillus alcaliphilus]
MNQQESALFRVLQVIASFLALQLLWMFFSLGVVTIIPATIALYVVIMEWSRNGINLGIWKPFYHAFVTYFKRTIYIAVFVLSIITVLALNLVVISETPASTSWIFQASGIFIAGIFMLLLLAILPLLVSSHLKGFLLWKNAWITSMLALPDLLMIGVIAVVFSIVVFYFPGALIIAFSVFAFIHISLWKKVMQKLPQDLLDQCLLKYRYR